mmetsp:Transcript_1013/g.3081  ORF Transcript_1013/g.3081 Transcript_1013/m.3081 type:complete len:233 (-) Transcript_1013:472-1170(-)
MCAPNVTGHSDTFCCATTLKWPPAIQYNASVTPKTLLNTKHQSKIVSVLHSTSSPMAVIRLAGGHSSLLSSLPCARVETRTDGCKLVGGGCCAGHRSRCQSAKGTASGTLCAVCCESVHHLQHHHRQATPPGPVEVVCGAGRIVRTLVFGLLLPPIKPTAEAVIAAASIATPLVTPIIVAATARLTAWSASPASPPLRNGDAEGRCQSPGDACCRKTNGWSGGAAQARCGLH